MLFYEVTDALGVGGLFRDVVKPLDTYLTGSECEVGRSTSRISDGSSAPETHDALTRRGSARCTPETVQAHPVSA
ncbi:MAG: hypothetical protein PGN34_18605 [Methylobacterium frigidaeris]